MKGRKMSVLSSEQRDGVLAQLRGGETEQPAQASQPFVDGQEEEAVEGESEYEEETEPSGHAVPYSRFSKVISDRNEIAERAEQSQSRIAELEAQLTQLKNLKELFGNQQQDQHDTYAEPEEVSEVDALRQSMMEISEQQQYDSIERELAQIESLFPNVPSEMLLQAVIDDPNVNMTELASTYSTHVAEVEESAIARYLEEQGLSSAPQDIPPEVGHTGGRSSAPGNKLNASSIREVTERLLKEGF
jgi:hypothetical protein